MNYMLSFIVFSTKNFPKKVLQNWTFFVTFYASVTWRFKIVKNLNIKQM